ncbi:DUF4304 domain-containing protein [Ornithinibacillus xuwenensis]|uniref:DUF4304 domain-containing protein n=1 Tax=Ornithinibacillus xuwenensis TaxID=3144668 RepID=A0ABU9XIZ1_9BACI
MNQHDVFHMLLKETIAPLLKAYGFKKKGKNFSKILSDIAWTVNVQSSKWNTKEEAQFTINTGIFTNALFGTFYNHEAPQFPTEGVSVLRLQITELKNTADTWYKLNHETNLKQLTSELEYDIEEIVLPHLNQFQTIDDVIKEMERREKMKGWYENPHFLTILYHAAGYEKKALKRLKKMHTHSNDIAQRDFIKELSIRMGLSI